MLSCFQTLDKPVYLVIFSDPGWASLGCGAHRTVPCCAAGTGELSAQPAQPLITVQDVGPGHTHGHTQVMGVGPQVMGDGPQAGHG